MLLRETYSNTKLFNGEFCIEKRSMAMPTPPFLSTACVWKICCLFRSHFFLQEDNPSPRWHWCFLLILLSLYARYLNLVVASPSLKQRTKSVITPLARVRWPPWEYRSGLLEVIKVSGLWVCLSERYFKQFCEKSIWLKIFPYQVSYRLELLGFCSDLKQTGLNHFKALGTSQKIRFT